MQSCNNNNNNIFILYSAKSIYSSKRFTIKMYKMYNKYAAKQHIEACFYWYILVTPLEGASSRVLLCATYLYGMALRKMLSGFGPVMCRLMMRGSRICTGTIGMPSMASFSFGTPISISFRPVTASAAAKPICNRFTRKA